MELNLTLVRTLKGAPLSVFIALMLAHQPVSAEWIERTTGYTDKPVLSALKFLEENNFITRNERYGWQLATGVVQLPIMMPGLSDGQPESNVISEDPELFRVGIIPGPLASSSLTNLDSREENLLPSSSNADPENFRVAQNLAECERQKIHEPAKSRIAKQAHVTQEKIRYHCATSTNNGQAIYRIEHDWPLPKSVSVETVTLSELGEPPEAIDLEEFDELAERWWDGLAAKLRETLPRAVYDAWIPIDAPARRVGDALVVLVVNSIVGEVLGRHVRAAEMNDLVRAVSNGGVNRIQFVTMF